MNRSASIWNKRVLGYLSGGVAVLALINGVNFAVGEPLWTITRLVHLGFDNNIPAWYSSLLLAIAAILAVECFLVGKALNLPKVWLFLLTTGLLLFMSCDEIARFHEIAGELCAKYSGLSAKEYAQHSDWVWFGGPIILLIFGALGLCLKKIMTEVRGCCFLLALGLGCIVFGGIVLEAITNWLSHDMQWVWNIEIVIEESLEMLGTLLIALALMTWRDAKLKSKEATIE